MDSISLSEVTTALRDIQLTRYTGLSAVAIILYDHLITFDEEVELIWNKRTSLVKILFLLIRYYNLLVISNLHDVQPSFNCESDSFTQWQFVSAIIVFTLTEIVLQVRIYAIYGRSKKVLMLILPLFILSIATSIVFSVLDIKFEPETVLQFGNVSFCAGTKKWSPRFGFWIPALCYETLLCVLVLYKGYETIRLEMPLGWSGSRAIKILVRDSAFYYLVIFTAYLVNMLVWSLADEGLSLVSIGYAVALPTTVTERLLLNIRRAFTPNPNQYPSTDTHLSITPRSKPDEGIYFESMELKTMGRFRASNEVHFGPKSLGAKAQNS